MISFIYKEIDYILQVIGWYTQSNNQQGSKLLNHYNFSTFQEVQNE